MSEDEIKSYALEKHQTRDIVDGHTNGFLIPVWKDWEGIQETTKENILM